VYNRDTIHYGFVLDVLLWKTSGRARVRVRVNFMNNDRVFVIMYYLGAAL